MLHRTSLASGILIAVLGILAVTMTAGLGLYLALTRSAVDQQARQQAAAIASSVGDMPSISSDLADGDPHEQIRVIAAQVTRDTDAAYVVVIDAHGLRYSHPTAALIGRRVTEPVIALDGKVHTGTDNGSLGRSANARAPVRDAATGKPIGEVSVGILETEVSQRIHQVLSQVVLFTILVLFCGVAASMMLARAIKRITFGLEPGEIVALVLEREAMLHGIREGVIAFDLEGRASVINDEARRLLGLKGTGLGRPAADLVAKGRVRDLLTGTVSGADLVAVTDQHLLVLNRMPVRVAGRNTGWVITIRDQTELDALVRQLDSVQALTTALRAQQHEYANRLHVIATLLELGENDEATSYCAQLSGAAFSASDSVRSRVGPAVVAAMLLAKTAVAAERDVEVVLEGSSSLPDGPGDYDVLLTVLGNLVDNAIDAIADSTDSAARHPKGTVTVNLNGDAEQVRLIVSDTGPGIPSERLPEVFVDGYTTKTARHALRRGVGLALVHRMVLRAGGSVVVTSVGGARFEVRLPLQRSVARP